MASPSNLVCKECGYVNEAERVYCHGCGAKLDRTVILAEQEKKTLSREEKQRQVRKLMKPRGGSFLWREIVMLPKILAWAAGAALLVLILEAPDGVPPMPKKGEAVNLPQLGDSLERLAKAPLGQGYIFREEEINAYLLKKPFRKIPEWFTGVIPLRRSFVNLESGQARLTVQADLAGYPVYIGISGQPKGDPQKGLSVAWTGLHLGRITLPAAVADLTAPALPALFDALKRERQLLAQFGGAEIAKGQVILRSRGPQPFTAVPNAAR